MPQSEKRETELRRLKDAAVAFIDSCREELIEMSLKIRDNPEPAFEEFHASRLLADYLSTKGFEIEYGAYGLETAFRGTIGHSGPGIGFMAEYDAVDIGGYLGHGCAHNIIGTMGAAAGAALASIIGETGGRAVVFGTPGEELNKRRANGKELMARRGAFHDIDAAMMTHPWHRDSAPWDAAGLIIAEAEYFGKASHPTAAEAGINALDAMFISFTAYAALRQQILSASGGPRQYSSGYIVKAGIGAHIIPDHTKAHLVALAWTDDSLKDLLDRVHNCFKAGEIATGARLEFNYDFDNRYRTLRSNRIMSQLFDANMKSIRPDWNPIPPTVIYDGAATDMGSVSQITPSIHPGVSLSKSPLRWHSEDVVRASGSEEGRKLLLDGAKALALTAIDLITRSDILEQAREEFVHTWQTLGKE